MQDFINPLFDNLDEIIKKSLSTVNTAPEPDLYTNLESLDLDKQMVKIGIIEKRQNLEERKKYAKYIFVMLCIWLFLMLAIIVLSGFKKIPGTSLIFELTEPVLITLITTTTINIAAFFLVVTKNLFPTKSEKTD